jgi:hypothetical protein
MNASILNKRISLSRPWQFLLGGILFMLLVALLAAGIHAVMANNTVGMDLHTFYLAAQNVFLKHNSPYGEDVAVQSQLSVLRHLATEQDDQMGFAYPPYSLLILAPIAGLSFDWVQAIWMAFVLMGSVFAMLLAFPRRPLLPVLGVLFFYPFAFGIILGNFVNIIALILLGVVSQLFYTEKLTRNTQILFGILLAWATIKPQFVWLFMVFFLLVSLKHHLWPMIISFSAGLVVFLGLSFLMVPNWPVLWFERIGKYAQYMGKVPNITLFLNQLHAPEDAQTFTLALFALLLGVTIWALFSWWKGKLPALVLLAWIGIVTYLVHPRSVAYSQTAFLIPLLVWAYGQRNLRSRPVIFFYWAFLLISWITFILGKQGLLGSLPDEWFLVAGCIWMFWLLVWPPASKLLLTSKSRPV